mmetsp:Transcript_2087/g.4928  ORF Transcript_2087/g.4928 Transcript_2087/m.4928 type:complete len:95 (+) Transcript_2087:50-334(+)
MPDTNVSDVYEMPPLQKPVMRTSGRFKIVQLKKYLLSKLDAQHEMPVSYHWNQVEVICNGSIVGNELSLTFIKRTIWLGGNGNMELTYRVSEEP